MKKKTREKISYYTEWSKSEREKEISYSNAHIWNLERWYWWTYLQGRNRDSEKRINLWTQWGTFSSVSQLCPTLCDSMNRSMPGLPVHHQFRSSPKPIELVMPSNHLILFCPLLILPSIFPSIRAFSNESSLHIRWPKYWSFSFSVSPSNKYSGLISFRIHWVDLLAVQGTLKSLLQHYSSKA